MSGKLFTRETLRKCFAGGARPSADDFSNLIDSALIMEDEGFIKTPEDGLVVAASGTSNGLISFKRPTSAEPDWSIGFVDTSGESLAVRRGDAASQTAPILTFTQTIDTDSQELADGPGWHGTVAVGVQGDQRSLLRVNGTLQSAGRMGQACEPVPADGKLHPISPILTGCVALEVMAGVGVANSGRFALLHAIAMNAYNPMWWDNIFGWKKRIHGRHAYYGRRSDRLQLKWVPEAGSPANQFGHDARYRLHIRTCSDYRAKDRRQAKDGPAVDDPTITAYVTCLWPCQPANKLTRAPA